LHRGSGVLICIEIIAEFILFVAFPLDRAAVAKKVTGTSEMMQKDRTASSYRADSSGAGYFTEKEGKILHD
jgi:hypothetical protein